MYFFKTLKEKEFVWKQFKKGNTLPLLKYLIYRARLSHLFFLKRQRYKMRVWYAPYALWLWNHEGSKKEEEEFINYFLKEGDVIIDCGAHLGTLSIVASKKVGQKGTVIALEPHPRTFSYLARNSKDNRCENITCINKAISDKEGKAFMTDSYVSDMNHIGDDGNIVVLTTTLDAIARDLEKIDLIKLDVEGYELQALKGGEETLKKTRAIYFESAGGSFARYGYSLKDMMKYLKEKGFDCFFVREGNALEEVPENHVTKTRYENIVAIKNGE